MLKNHKKEIGFILGIAIAVLVWNANFSGLTVEGQRLLALTLKTVTFWAFNVTHPGFTSGIFLTSLVIFQVAPPESIFSLWTSSVIYLVIGAYLIAEAVNSSGLGKRIAYNLIIKFVSSYKNLIFSIFILTFILSLLIPHPWPRAFLIMSVIAVVIKSAKIAEEDAAKVGFAVFAFSVPLSLIFLTGDSTINIMAVEFSGVDLSWFGWLYYVGVPAILASFLTLFLFLKVFKPREEVHFDIEQIKKNKEDLGQMSIKEKKLFFGLHLLFYCG